jgi:hypothetical protein
MSLLVICKTPQIGLKTLVDNFSSSISLWMISGAKMQLGSLDPENVFPEIVGES